MTTVSLMAFVWSRLALAAVLAAGAACAQASACPDAATCAEAPRLACAAELPTINADLGDRTIDGPVIVTAGPRVALPPRTVIDLALPSAAAAPTRGGDVLAVAPKTSPPRS